MSNEYGVNQIHKLDGLEAVRKRPGMYIGSTSQSGIDQLIYEVIDNSIDEYVMGFGKNIYIHVEKDGTVNARDEGRGIPVGVSEEFKDKNGKPMNALTGILTTLHAGGKFGDEGYKCFTEDSLIHTKNGLKKISDIQIINDYVLNARNEYARVDNKFEYDFDGDIVCITTENGKQIKAIDGHRILVKTIDDKLEWREIDKIKIDDFLVELEENDNVEELECIIPINFEKKYNNGNS